MQIVGKSVSYTEEVSVIWKLRPIMVDGQPLKHLS